jgi:hypothetical protein
MLIFAAGLEVFDIGLSFSVDRLHDRSRCDPPERVIEGGPVRSAQRSRRNLVARGALSSTQQNFEKPPFDRYAGRVRVRIGKRYDYADVNRQRQGQGLGDTPDRRE